MAQRSDTEVREHDQQEHWHGGEAALQKKRYATPVLIHYGSVAKLTQTRTGSGSDGGPTNFRMVGACL